MADTSYPSISQKFKLIDVIDDEWILDQLSDDEIEISKEFDLKPDEEEEDLNVDSDDVWDDLGLDVFDLDGLRIGLAPSHSQLQTTTSANNQSSNSS